MSKQILIALAAAGVLSLTACQTTPAGGEKSAGGTVSAEAQAALSKAEADVKAANAKKALWTNADDALKAAKDAAAKGDSDGAMKNAKKASEFAKMGMEQKAYPLISVNAGK
jgi:murein lipoprotein